MGKRLSRGVGNGRGGSAVLKGYELSVGAVGVLEDR